MKPTDLNFIDTEVPLLSHFTAAQRRQLAEGSEVREFEPGAMVVYAGDEVHFLGVVLEGSLSASARTADGGSVAVGKFGPGDTFGELALMSGDPAVADLKAEA